MNTILIILTTILVLIGAGGMTYLIGMGSNGLSPDSHIQSYDKYKTPYKSPEEELKDLPDRVT